MSSICQDYRHNPDSGLSDLIAPNYQPRMITGSTEDYYSHTAIVCGGASRTRAQGAVQKGIAYYESTPPCRGAGYPRPGSEGFTSRYVEMAALSGTRNTKNVTAGTAQPVSIIQADAAESTKPHPVMVAPMVNATRSSSLYFGSTIIVHDSFFCRTAQHRQSDAERLPFLAASAVGNESLQSISNKLMQRVGWKIATTIHSIVIVLLT